jgi:hypothetical protein
MGGIEAWSADGRDRVFLEASNTSCFTDFRVAPLRLCAYRNYNYPDGYANGGRWIGSSMGPDSHLFTLGWLADGGDTSVRLRVGYIGSQIGTYSPAGLDPATAGPVIGVAAKRSFAWGPATLTPEIEWDRVKAGSGTRQSMRAGVSFDLDLDAVAGDAPARVGQSLLEPSSTSTRVLLAGALIAGSAALDRTADEYSQAHRRDLTTRALIPLGDNLPLAGLGVAGLAWLIDHDPQQRDLAWQSIEAGLGAAAASEALHLVVDRSRPGSGRGPWDFGGPGRLGSSFSSTHTALAWGLVTPVAEQMDAPWLYGLALLTNASRVLDRDHWLSDTVAGALLGYEIGDFVHARAQGMRPAAVGLSLHGVAVSWTLP